MRMTLGTLFLSQETRSFTRLCQHLLNDTEKERMLRHKRDLPTTTQATQTSLKCTARLHTTVVAQKENVTRLNRRCSNTIAERHKTVVTSNVGCVKMTKFSDTPPRWKVTDLQNLGVHPSGENRGPHHGDTVCDRTYVSGALIGSLPFSQSQYANVTQ